METSTQLNEKNQNENQPTLNNAVDSWPQWKKMALASVFGVAFSSLDNTNSETESSKDIAQSNQTVNESRQQFESRYNTRGLNYDDYIVSVVCTCEDVDDGRPHWAAIVKGRVKDHKDIERMRHGLEPHK